MDIVLSMPWLFPETVFSRFSHVQACLCSCFLRGTFSSLQSWCQLDSRAARKSRCVVDEVGLPVKQNHFCSFFSVSSPGSEVLDSHACLHAVWVQGLLSQWHEASKLPSFLCNQRCVADVGRVKNIHPKGKQKPPLVAVQPEGLW